MMVIDIIINSLNGDRRAEVAVPGRPGARFKGTAVIRRGPPWSRAVYP